MPQLTINFNTVPGAADYEVCYKPTTSSTYTCTTVSAPPVVITTGIDCGVDYDVRVRTRCTNGLFSDAVTVSSNRLECPPAGLCYTISIYYEQANSNTYVKYTPPGGTTTTVAANTLPLNGSNFYVQSFCSTSFVELVDSSGNPVSFIMGGSLSGGTVACASAEDCSTVLTRFDSAGIGPEACSNQTQTVYSNCNGSSFGVNCTLYSGNSTSLPLTGVSQVFVNFTLYDVDPITGVVTGVSAVQC